jgi:Xaa-Pro dipeptidase
MAAFERNEYLQRLANARKKMSRQGLDLLFVTTPENINYLCGYAAWSFYTPQALIVTAGSGEPLLVVREMDVACARFTAFLSEASLIGYPESFIGGERHPMEYIVQLISDRAPSIRRVGIEPAGSFFTVQSYEKLKAGLPACEFVDSAGLVNWLRTIKSDAEIGVMREAARTSDAGMAAAIEHICVGARECDVSAEIYRTIIRGREGAGGGVPAAFTLVSGPRTSAPHIPWTDNRLERGQCVNLEMGGTRHQYHAGLSRSFFLGTPPRPLLTLSKVVVDGMNAALAAVKPGRTCESVALEWQRVIGQAGYRKASRIGYSIGLGFQPTWIDYSASLQQGDLTVLTPNMTFHMICGMWHGTDNCVLSETFRVSESGCEVLTHAPRELIVKA